MKEKEDGNECCEELPFGHDMAVVDMESQQQWLSTQDLHKVGPIIHSVMKGLYKSL